MRHPKLHVVADPATPDPRSPAAAGTADFLRDLAICLEERPHAIAPKYFYDAAGSHLFEQICELPEYYLTRTELAIFGRELAAIAALIGPGAEIVEFGAGSLQKVRLLLDALDSPRRLVAIDLSGEHLAAATAELRRSYPEVEIVPVVADFTALDRLPPLWTGSGRDRGRRVGFFPGSTLGNLDPAEARRFLAGAARLLAGGGLLIGIDLVKDPARLHAAYNDAAGVTAAFNRNLLARANRELGADFDPFAFAHYAFYEPRRQRIEMHLISRRRQAIHLAGRRFELAEGETIHTENSYKYTPDGFRALAAGCGFLPGAWWCDAGRLFSVHWLESPHASDGA